MSENIDCNGRNILKERLYNFFKVTEGHWKFKNINHETVRHIYI